ncbi:FxsA family protein [Paenibacillus daejeonensis]|uniref:FxsA family protein n=1 Tax=Paenibacillus daejeonensis TaxID=135193 RepID=UPI000374875A|nr:FxsA family protein [Paenibacillus daejeonensis]
MRRWLFLLLLLIPILEFWVITLVGSWIGGWPTFLLILGTALLGFVLIKLEGRKVWQEAQLQMQAGQIPGLSLLDGLCILIGGILLIIPGFLSDIVGLALVIPFTRPYFRQHILNWLERRMRGGGGGGGVFMIRRW